MRLFAARIGGQQHLEGNAQPWPIDAQNKPCCPNITKQIMSTGD